ncbi:hypothetical protein ACOME3_000865 [Neoechinorhynchus agilis]
MLGELFGGVTLVQLNNVGRTKTNADIDPIAGFLYVVCASTLSGFSGVYTEKLLKDSTNPGTWARNVHLSFYGSLLAGIIAAITKGEVIKNHGIFNGFGLLTWFCVLSQSVGGILVALVLKSHDNIIKGFTNAASLLLSTLLGVTFLDSQCSLQFFIGLVLVLISIVVYLNSDHVMNWFKQILRFMNYGPSEETLILGLEEQTAN